MVLIVFGLAFVLGVILFFVFPPRRAAIACLIGGWALLPTANFSMPNAIDPAADLGMLYAMAVKAGIGSSLIGPYWLTRSSVIGLTVLLGMLFTDFKSMRRLRPRWFDLPIVIWCISPLFSGLLNQQSIEQVLMGGSYQILAWGAPYLAGRLYFSDIKPLRELGIGLVIAGLCYVPICLVEMVCGPIFYEMLYQWQPYATDGSIRMIGFRPIGLLEHGNQLGIWMSSIAMLAFWMHMCGALPRLKFIPSHVAVLILIGTALLCQSAGAVLLMIVGIITFALFKQGVKIPYPVWITGLAGVVALGVFVAGGDKAVGKVIGQQRVEQFKNLSRIRTIGWRINAIRRGMGPIKDQPIIGTGQWDWWTLDENSDRPVWNLFIQGWGQHGIFAVVALLGVFIIPVWQFIDGCPAKLWTDINLGPPAALVIYLIMHGIDGMLNPAFCTSLVCVAGGLNTIGPFLKRALKPA